MRTLILYLAFIVSITALAISARYFLSPESSLTVELLYSAAGRYAILATGFVVLTSFSPGDLEVLRTDRLWWSPTLVVCILLVLILAYFRLPYIMTYPPARVASFALAMAAVAILEEVLFRGLFFLHWQRRISRYPVLVLAILSSALFGLSHLVNIALVAGQSVAGSWTLVLYSFGMGMLFCGITYRTGTLAPAILLHFAANFFLGTTRLDHSALFSAEPVPASTTAIGLSTLVPTLILYLLLSGVGVLLLRSDGERTKPPGDS